MKEIRMVDLKSQYQNIKSEINSAIQQVIDSSVFIKGDTVSNFSNNLASHLQVKHVIPVGNGTDALRIALLALDLKPGDEIITSTFTFVATAEVAASIGCVPVLVDVDLDNYCILPGKIEEAITDKTKVIIPVHLFGQNAPMHEILEIAHKHNIAVIEDACQSINSKYISPVDKKIHMSGSMGIAGCTSFFPSKNLGCYGDGGAIFTDNDEMAEKMSCIANHGMKVRYHYERVGLNSRLDAIQAAILNTKLRYLDQYTEARQSAALKYDNLLADCQFIQIPKREEFSTHVFHQYTIKVLNGKRDELKSKLQENGIPSMVYYPIPLHLHKPYMNKKYSKEMFKNSEYLSQSVLSLPMHTELEDEQIQYICKTIKESF